MKRILTVTAVAAGLILAGGAALASIPDGGGVIHACYKVPVPAHGGPLSVIDSGAGGSCPSGYTELTWNQTGPQGPAGAVGPQGPAGADGAPGVSGYSTALCNVTVISFSESVVNSSSGGTCSVVVQPTVVTLTCPAGKVALSASNEFGGVQYTYLTPDDAGYKFGMNNNGTSDLEVTCATAG